MSTTTTSGASATRRTWRPRRSTAVVVACFTVAVVVALWVGAGDEEYDGALDPRNPGRDGGQALARVLDEEGVDVRVVRSASALEDAEVDPSTTVVVTGPEDLSPSTLERLRAHAGPGRLVLVDTYRLIEEIDPGLGAVTGVPAETTADCADAQGRTEGPGGVDLTGLSLEVDSSTVYAGFELGGPVLTCFPVGAGVLLAEDPGRGVILFGAGEALSNDQVLRGDNAAIALRLLGTGDHLVWYVPDPADAQADEAVDLRSLLPRWVGPGLWMGALAMIALVLWRVRRMGPLATEPLPVVVRAVETARSRGRMYRKGSDRAHAATQLRRAARTDLAARLRLDPRADPATIADAAARQLGVPPEAIAPLLSDDQPPPASDRDLVALAQQLTHLRREVRSG